MFNSEITTINMCDIHIATILLTVMMCTWHMLICSIQKLQLLLPLLIVAMCISHYLNVYKQTCLQTNIVAINSTQ